MANINKKVYINPNFNINQVNSPPVVCNKTMYINPNFSQQPMHNRSRIYVNPNFVKANIVEPKPPTESPDFTSPNVKLYNKMNVTSAAFPEKPKEVWQQTVSKSRYSFVRHNGNKNNEDPITVKAPTIKTITVKAPTIKINKYKSVAISNYKKSYNSIKAVQEPLGKYRSTCYGQKTQVSDKCVYKSPFTNYYQSKYKICKRSLPPKLNIETEKLKRKLSLDLSRSIKKINHLKIKISKGHLKKNNIPCPLFRKFGKCLRSIKGTCEFLHDKKHVSICRKFIKGICHDKNCLLSHDLTTKKMPTCYFFLKGMCTKDACPYLHVKLNDKTKLCSDFLKGYCEKGDKCLDRHISINPKKRRTGKPNKILKSPAFIKTNQINKKYRNIVRKLSSCDLKQSDTEGSSVPTDGRYYKDIVTHVDETTEIIKPSRCKLGTLPSFIKF